MCGFVVLINRPAGGEGADVCESIQHRGPESCGHIGLGGDAWSVDVHFRRLAIVDLDPRSDQPFGDHVRGHLVYNGEIYNAGALRRRLSARGVPLRTTGDTEVLFEVLLQSDWEELLREVDGMFAFAFVSPSGVIRYGRDRLGIKPLYEATGPDGALLGLASEVAPLRRAGLLGPVDVRAVAAAAMFLWVPPPATGWQRCRQSSPGQVITRTPPLFVQPSATAIGPLPGPAESIENSVRESLRRQLTADVPVALLLSGGLDSTWLAHELHRAGQEVPFLSARAAPGQAWSSEPFDDDAPFAQRVADGLGRDLKWVELDRALVRRIPEMVGVLEQPFGDPAAISLMALSAAAADQATVLLSGVGVEELFLGYERYQVIKALSSVGPARAGLRPLLARLPLSRRLRERATKLERVLQAEPSDWLWASQSYFSPAAWRRLFPSVPLDAVVARHREVAAEALEGGASLLEAAATVDSALFLPGLNLMYADRASMRSSVELRVPFLGEPVRAAAQAFSSRQHVGIGNGKRRFRAAAKRAGVPPFVLRRSKTGFGAPVRTIMRDHGPAICRGIARSEIFDDLVDRPAAEQMFDSHARGEADLGLPLFGLCSLAVWWERNVGSSSTAADFLAEAEF